MKRIGILGSTGSIGTQTLEVIDLHKDLEVVAITANKSAEKVFDQCVRYMPELVAMMDTEAAEDLTARLERAGIDGIKVVSGMDGLIEVSVLESVDVLVTAVVGMIGLVPTVEAIKAGKTIALANKETLVTAGEIIMPLARKMNVKILPVDSEHSAIYQSLAGHPYSKIEKVVLTASGGPFRGKTLEELEEVTLEDALKHPNWEMGAKITIDSSTLMNKGLEVIEAKWLFDVTPEQIDVVVHPQSILHSMVMYVDGSCIGQMGLPDMKLPIQYALYEEERETMPYERLNLAKIGSLTFEEPDRETFKCLNLAFKSIKIGGELPTVLNAANEKAVELFLNKKIEYLDIPKVIEGAMDTYLNEEYNEERKLSIPLILETEKWAHNYVVASVSLTKRWFT